MANCRRSRLHREDAHDAREALDGAFRELDRLATDLLPLDLFTERGRS